MNEADKKLLLKDICSRLPYGVKLGFKNSSIILTLKNYDCFTGQLFTSQVFPEHDGTIEYGYQIYDYRPYLRPLSSMTEDEKEYIKNRWCYEDWDDIYDFLNHYKIDAGDTYAFTDWLNEHHFDYRGLIRKGLALEAPKDMYKIE